MSQMASLLVASIDHAPPENTLDYSGVTWVFPLPSNTFTGRRVLVEEVKSKLAKGGQIIALIGPGGSGKTKIALKAVEGIVSIEPMWYLSCYLDFCQLDLVYRVPLQVFY